MRKVSLNSLPDSKVDRGDFMGGRALSSNVVEWPHSLRSYPAFFGVALITTQAN